MHATKPKQRLRFWCPDRTLSRELLGADIERDRHILSGRLKFTGREGSCMDPLHCPLCREFLEPTKRRYGLVWVCCACRAGAVTLPILRQVASRPFVNHLWQTALHNGCPSTVVCPACTQPFTEFRGASAAVNAQLKVWCGASGSGSVPGRSRLPRRQTHSPPR